MSVKIPQYDRVCSRCLCYDCWLRGDGECPNDVGYCVDECGFTPTVRCESYDTRPVAPISDKPTPVLHEAAIAKLRENTDTETKDNTDIVFRNEPKQDSPDKSDKSDKSESIEQEDYQEYGKIFEL